MVQGQELECRDQEMKERKMRGKVRRAAGESRGDIVAEMPIDENRRRKPLGRRRSHS